MDAAQIPERVGRRRVEDVSPHGARRLTIIAPAKFRAFPPKILAGSGEVPEAGCPVEEEEGEEGGLGEGYID